MNAVAYYHLRRLKSLLQKARNPACAGFSNPPRGGFRGFVAENLFSRLSTLRYLLERAPDWLAELVLAGDSPAQPMPPAVKAEVRAPITILVNPPSGHIWRSYYYAGGQRVAAPTMRPFRLNGKSYL